MHHQPSPFDAPLRLLPGMLLGTASLLQLGLAQGQTPEAPPKAQTADLGSIQHTIQLGDTLEQLSRQYLGDGSLWPAVRAHNGNVHPLRLSPGSLLEIPLQLLRTAAASVDYVHGNASLSRSNTTTQEVRRGQTLQEGDALQLEPDAYVTVRLADGSTVRIQTHSQVTLQQLRRRGRAGSLQTVIQLDQGGLEVEVPGAPDANRQLEVITPVAATSVRGTHFDVRTSAGRTSTSVQRGAVAMQQIGTAAQGQVLNADQGLAISAGARPGTPTPLLPPIPTHSLPQHSANPHWLDLTFPALAGASAYMLHIAEDAVGDTVIYQALLEEPKARLDKLPDGNYWLKLRALDAQGIVGQPSQVPLHIKAHPVAPLAQFPAPAATAALGSQLECTPVNEAQAYVLQVAALGPEQNPIAADFNRPLLEAIDSPNCQLDLSRLSPGHYAWRSASVRWQEGQRDQGPYSAHSSFSLAEPPTEPEALEPKTFNGISHLYWPGQEGQRYRLQAFPQASVDAPPAVDIWLDQPQWQAQSLSPGQWHIRIQVEDSNGLQSAFTPTHRIEVLPLVVDGSGQAIGTGSGLGLEY